MKLLFIWLFIGSFWAKMKTNEAHPKRPNNFNHSSNISNPTSIVIFASIRVESDISERIDIKLSDNVRMKNFVSF
ncbi:hypothetical protein ACH3XW_38770 [Acanthocheilonema viteae]